MKIDGLFKIKIHVVCVGFELSSTGYNIVKARKTRLKISKG